MKGALDDYLQEMEQREVSEKPKMALHTIKKTRRINYDELARSYQTSRKENLFSRLN